ncbi:MAG: Mov34/MPN/PAD-1 family protein [Candidatus Micrarchaeota archaeon]
MVKIRSAALESALLACRNVHPYEFIGLFRENAGVLEELIVAPLAEYGRAHSSFSDLHLPTDPSLAASIHSHPNGVLLPSRADLKFFAWRGKWHFIAGAPYGMRDVACYDASGKPQQIEVD